MGRKVNAEKGKQGFQPTTAGIVAPNSDPREKGGFFSRLFGKKQTTQPTATELDPNNPFSDVLAYWQENPHNPSYLSGSGASSHTGYATTPRETPPTRPIPSGAQAEQEWREAFAAANTDYRFGPHDVGHARVASLLEAHDRNALGVFTYETPDRDTLECPIDHEASSRYIKAIAADIVELHENQRTSDGKSGARGVYSRDTVELAYEVIRARDSSPAGASTADLYKLADYTQTDGRSRSTWHLKGRVSMLLSNIERDHRKSDHLKVVKAEQEARVEARKQRFANVDW